jgi:acyl-CoA hydrolase
MARTYYQEYKEKLISAAAAAALVNSGDKILYAVFLGRPVDFDLALAKRKEELFNVQVTQCAGNTPGANNSAFADPSQQHFTSNSWFFDGVERKLHDKDMMYYNPCQFGQLQDIISSDLFPYDIYVQKVSPMDQHGFFSFGLANVNSLESCLGAKTLILEVNENMPRVPGGSEDAIHISMVDYIIESTNSPLLVLPPTRVPSPVDKAMAGLLLPEIPDRACLQLGIGALPNLLGDLLCNSDLRDLGIHTEMFTDSMVNLFETGKVTNRYKRTDRCKMTFTFALGMKSTYDFMNENPLMASHCGRYTNNQNIIASNENFIAINNTVMVDLFSQACSESSGPRQISGTGGQLDFINGAWHSTGGKNFLCLTSTYTDKQGQLRSRIVPTLPAGSIVTTSRTFIDYIVTEYGKVQLKGKPTWHRAEQLISIAHPQFRDELIKEAALMNIWRRTNKTE